jgi:hypothetical protein
MNQPTCNENTPVDIATFGRRSSEVAPRRRPKRKSLREIDALSGEPGLPGIGTMARTKRLILAALRVWELKQGIRES